MAKDKTIIRPPQPFFGIHEIAYIRESAIKGFVEPIVIARCSFHIKLNTYVYRYLKNRRLSDVIIRNGRVAAIGAAADKDLAPVSVTEDDLITLCEALSIQISFLEDRLAEANDELSRVCGSGGDELPKPQQATIDSDFIVRQPIPRFGINEIVYLAETAQAVGRLERMRVDGLDFGPQIQKWIYTFVFEQKPGENMTVGDRNDLRSGVVITKNEDELLTVCEAIPLRIDFLERALNTAQTNQGRFCEESG